MPTSQNEYGLSKCTSRGYRHSTRLIYCLVARRWMRISNTYKFEILPIGLMRWLFVAWAGKTPFHLSARVDPRKPFCAAERIVKEAPCLLRNPTRESFL